MEQILELSRQNLVKAYQIINKLKIKEIWESSGGTCNLVGSVKNNLLLNHLDIDFHTYTDDFSITKSFQAIARICERPGLKTQYTKTCWKQKTDVSSGTSPIRMMITESGQLISYILKMTHPMRV